jgi:hypothetical protein
MWSIGGGSTYTAQLCRKGAVDLGPRHVQTHKVSLEMVFLWIWRQWRLGISFNMYLDGVGVWRPSLTSASAQNLEDGSIIFPTYKVWSWW